MTWDNKAYSKAYYAKNKDYHAEWSLMKKYGITLEEYDHLWNMQDGVCAICGGTNPSGRRLAVDHDHDTGAVRALLCTTCNVRIGVVENAEFMAAASEYINNHKI